MLDDQKINSLIREFYAVELSALDERLLLQPVRDRPTRQKAETLAHLKGHFHRDALARNDLQIAGVGVEELVARLGITEELDRITIAKLQRGLLRAMAEISRVEKARAQGKFYHEPEDPLFKDVAPVSPPVIARATPTPAEQPPSPAPSKPVLGDAPFVETAEQFRQMRMRRNIWDKQYGLQARKTYELFAEICGERPIGGYNRDDAVRFKNRISDLPADYSKAVKYKDLTVDQILGLTSEGGVVVLSPSTVRRHLSVLSALWEDAIERRVAAANIFANFKLKVGKRAKDQRAMWSSDKLTAFFNTPNWRGCTSAVRRNDPGPCMIRDARFWLPLIALFSGMRQEEICQLDLADLRQEEGVWVFDVNDRPPHQLKNRNAVRLVPVHRELIRIGLLDYAEGLRAAGKTRLFEELERGGAEGRYGHNYAKSFTRYRRLVGLYEPNLDFHSFRHSATTFLAQAGVSNEIIDELTGHATPGETSRYTKEYLIGQLKEAIDQIDPRVDLTFLHLSEHVAG